MRKGYVVGLAVLVLSGLLFAQGPKNDASIFYSDCNDANLVDWIQVVGECDYTSSGMIGGGIRVYTPSHAQEGFARANMEWVPSDWDEYVTQFWVKSPTSTSWDMRIFDPYSPGFAYEVDIMIDIKSWDWVTGMNAWDFHVTDATGATGVTIRLAAASWHKFVVYHKADNTVELWVNDSLAGVYQARNPGKTYGELQFGDISGNFAYGEVCFDEFSIGLPLVGGESVIFADDFGTADLSKWDQTQTGLGGVIEYDSSDGNPIGSMHVDTWLPNEEATARKNLAVSHDNWIVEFDVKVKGSNGDPIGGGFRIYDPYYRNPDYYETDARISIEDGDWNESAGTWNYHVTDSVGSHAISASLDKNAWHHFKLERTSGGSVILTVNNVLVGTYSAVAANQKLGMFQVGDMLSHQAQGDVYWDNFKVYTPAQDICGDAGHPYSEGDINQDCSVDYKDINILADNWLECNDPAIIGCIN